MALQNFAAQGARWNDVAKCAICLEGSPLEQDSRLDFETFPGEIDESYASAAYQENGAFRTSQPSTATYTGGNWGAFNLVLTFRADAKSRRLRGRTDVTTADLEGVLVEMERKVRWLYALQFPIQRKATALTERILKRARAAGVNPTAKVAEGLGQFKRSDPPYVLVIFGSFLTIRGYVTNASIKWSGPWHPTTCRPYQGEVTLGIQRLDEDLPTFKSVRNSAGAFRQTPNFGREVRGDVRVAARRDANQNNVVSARTSANLKTGILGRG